MGHWNQPLNVRAFFDEFARTTGFDPLMTDNWYSVKDIKLQNAGGSGLLKAFNYKLMRALSCAYPELVFEEERFRVRDTTKVRKGHWNDPANVRAFFDKFALAGDFDPLVPENWYSVRHTSLLNSKGSGLLKAHRLDLKKALSIAYPELKFKAKRFRTRRGIT